MNKNNKKDRSEEMWFSFTDPALWQQEQGNINFGLLLHRNRSSGTFVTDGLTFGMSNNKDEEASGLMDI